MNSADVAARNAKIMRAVDSVAGELPVEERPLFETFCQAVGRQLRPSYVAIHGPGGVPATLLPVYRLFRGRKAGEILVDVVDAGSGWVTVRTCMADQAFIVDTVRLLIATRGASYENGFNVVFSVERDENGGIVNIGGEHGLESVIQFEFSGLEGVDLEKLAAQIRRNLTLASFMVQDFRQMTEAVDSVAARFKRTAGRDPARADSLREAADFLSWLLADNFVFMGAVSDGVKLGFERAELGPDLALDTDGGWDISPWPEIPVQVRKGASESPVHRSGRVDEIRVRVPDERGDHAFDLTLRGMFTYRAVTQTSRHVPILRRVLSRLLQQEESRPGSWRYKGVANVFDSLPTEYLFTASVQEVGDMVERVLDAEVEQEVRVHVVRKPIANMVFALIAMPRAQFSDRLRQRMESQLREATGATYCDHGVFVGRFETVLVHFYLTGTRPADDAALEALRESLVDLVTPWEDRVYAALVEQQGEEKAGELISRYGGAFSEDYHSRTSTERSLVDLEVLDQVTDSRPVLADLYRDKKGGLNLRIYQLGSVILSDILPVLDNFGLIVNDQYADPVAVRGGPPADIDTFRLRGVWGVEDDVVLERRQLLLDAIEAVFGRRVEDDGMNRLVLRAGLSWKDVDLLRAYRGYSRQLGLRLTLPRVQEILLGQSEMAELLVRYFHLRFDPDLSEAQRVKQMAEAADAIEAGLRRIQNHDEDAVIRTFSGLMQATIRTNFYRTDLKAHYISFKVAHDRVPTMPEPRMKYEIYVHHREVEGLHLRGGPVARGGIRWSDRTDFRTEILGLVSTQMVKNVLIVPEGAKGGFLLKQVYRDWATQRAKADELYRWFIRGLLDLTDNYVGGALVHPPRVVFHDGDDPYLVVAADKGTAHLSDTANKVSAEYNFWLRDAFASGGSNGYDHKKVGITARGAWECVDRHFAEMGIDPKNQVFTAVGVGDCGGDVFGNGVIQYKTMKLFAAFNHQHVFLDPNPDPALSYEERLRLFNEVKGWGAYDTSKISEGGGVFDRAAKSMTLSPQAKKMLGALQDELAPDAVIRLILRMPVDLLWNGGIGTYVKASHESHLDAGDPQNDALRVNANELRCKCVSEGGNLGFSQAARIEYALSGGRINTDAVDNSGGVDMSDHEVNLKILLSPIVDSEELSLPARNTLIEELTDDVSAAVLADNDAHARQLSIDQLRSTRDPLFFSQAVQWVYQRSTGNRASLHLPSDEGLRQRKAGRKGLTRPELATLSAHVKMHIYKEMLDGNSDSIDGFDSLRAAYFPERIQQLYGPRLGTHMLAKPIGMTVILTQIIADMGATFFPFVGDITGRKVCEIAGACLRASEAFGLNELRPMLDRNNSGLDGRYSAWIVATDGVLGLLTSWLAPGELRPTAGELERTRVMLEAVAKHRGRADTDRVANLVGGLTHQGVPRDVAERCASMLDLTVAREIAMLQSRTNDSDRDAVVRFLAVGEASGLLSAIRTMEAGDTSSRWDPVARGILRTRFHQMLRKLLEITPLDSELRLGVDRLTTKLRGGKLAQIGSDVHGVLGDAPDVGAFLVAEERLRAAVLR